MLGIEEVSIILGLKPQTIRNKLSSGTFPLATYKVLGRLKWKLSEVENYINKLERIN
jgi:predicted DNA-binding transcriptional regulator AlpA